MQREQWISRSAFILAVIGSAVGLGNIWRFPYICYSNGGGAFLIPYFIALFTAGIPLMILEFGIGHMMRSGAPTAFAKVRKSTEWIGWCALIFGFVVVSYYTVVMAWSLNYLIYSLNLSWGADTKSFFFERFLKISPNPGDIGTVRLPIIISLIVCWLMMYFIVFKGIKFIGNLVKYTVIIPFVIIGIFIIRGLTLPGAVDGINFYLTPHFDKLLQPQVWLAAYGQVFFSLSVAFGILIAYASYLPKRSDTTNNAFISGLSDTAASFFAGFAVFSTLGYLAGLEGVGVSDVVERGKSIGLAFITYPTVISTLAFAQIFGFLFFLLLLTLAIDSAFSLLEAAATGLMDKWKISRKISVSILSAIAICAGILFTTNGGLYWLDIIDHFVTNFGLPLVALAQCVVIGYVFKAKNLREYINELSDFKIGRWWDVCICVVTPLILAFLFIMSVVDIVKARGYGGYPVWAVMLGGAVVVCGIIASIILMRARGAQSD